MKGKHNHSVLRGSCLALLFFSFISLSVSMETEGESLEKVFRKERERNIQRERAFSFLLHTEREKCTWKNTWVEKVQCLGKENKKMEVVCAHKKGLPLRPFHSKESVLYKWLLFFKVSNVQHNLTLDTFVRCSITKPFRKYTVQNQFGTWNVFFLRFIFFQALSKKKMRMISISHAELRGILSVLKSNWEKIFFSLSWQHF